MAVASGDGLPWPNTSLEVVSLAGACSVLKRQVAKHLLHTGCLHFAAKQVSLPKGTVGAFCYCYSEVLIAMRIRKPLSPCLNPETPSDGCHESPLVLITCSRQGLRAAHLRHASQFWASLKGKSLGSVAARSRVRARVC